MNSQCRAVKFTVTPKMCYYLCSEENNSTHHTKQKTVPFYSLFVVGILLFVSALNNIAQTA